MEHISFAEASLMGLTGYAVVFLGLILLMVVVMVMGKIMVSSQKKKQAPAPEAPAAKAVPAPGSAGRLALHDVPDRDAAMIMAIVAEKMGRPLNELRFKSIKEVKEK